MSGSSVALADESTLLSTRTRGVLDFLTRSIRKRSPPPLGFAAVDHHAITSTSRSVSSAASTMRTLRRCSGLWTPGVSRKTIWPPSGVGCLHPDDAVAGRLRLVGDDGELLADEAD